MNRLLKKHPQLITSTKDTVYIQSVQADTVFYYNQKDTVVIREGKLTVKYFYNQKDSTVFLRGKCDADTIIKHIEVPKIIEYKTKWYDKVARILSILFICCAFIAVVIILKKLIL